MLRIAQVANTAVLVIVTPLIRRLEVAIHNMNSHTRLQTYIHGGDRVGWGACHLQKSCLSQLPVQLLDSIYNLFTMKFASQIFLAIATPKANPLVMNRSQKIIRYCPKPGASK